MAELQEYLFGIPLSTQRNRDVEHGPFPYELLIATVAIMFFRTTIHQTQEPVCLRWFFAAMLGFLTYSNKSYELISAVELFSYAVPFWLYTDLSLSPARMLKLKLNNGKTLDSKVLRLLFIALSAVLSLVLCHLAASGDLFHWILLVTPSSVFDGLAALIPTKEVMAAYDIIDRFILEPGLLQYQVSRLLFITAHIQIGIGYLGIDFLKAEQQRRNELVRMDMSKYDDEEADDDDPSMTKKSVGAEKAAKDKAISSNLKKSRRFQKTAAPFILYTAVPYMFKIIGYGNLNAFAYACFKDDVHKAVRLYDLFDHDNHLVAIAEHSAKAPEGKKCIMPRRKSILLVCTRTNSQTPFFLSSLSLAYAGYMDTIVSTTYELFNRKLFSLPKVMLLPVIIARQPKMMAQIMPIIFFSDWVKGKAVAYMTSRIEQLEKETQEVVAMRSKVESFDMKNAELLQRAGKHL
jgi:hypothetical protein